MQWKSFLAGGAVVAVFASIVAAEQISVPNQFAAGAPARAAEVNANFDVLVQESNAQDERISEIDNKVQAFGSGEQLFCAADPRPSKATVNDGGVEVLGFPVPVVRFTASEQVASIVETPAVCISLSDPETLVESSPSQLTVDGWRFAGAVQGARFIQLGTHPEFRVSNQYDNQEIIGGPSSSGSLRTRPWYLYVR